MSNLITQYQIELSRSKKELQEQKIKIVRLMNELSERINPFFGDDIETIKAEEIKQISDELLEIRQKAIETQKKVKEIEAQLR